MKNAGCKYVALEVTSEGIKQWRHLGLFLDIVVFTNLSPEHLASHGGSFDEYRATKMRIFKKDIFTELVEMGRITSVPLNMLIMRGQSIKVTSCVAKKCRLMNTLIPVLYQEIFDDGFEGAIVIDPKTGLYLKTPISTLDFASLYPTSMKCHNLSPDSKVWTKEFDLENNLIKVTGERDEKGNFIYDHLPSYEYDIHEFNTYRYVRKKPTSKAEKVIAGKKYCCFAQFRLTHSGFDMWFQTYCYPSIKGDFQSRFSCN